VASDHRLVAAKAELGRTEKLEALASRVSSPMEAFFGGKLDLQSDIDAICRRLLTSILGHSLAIQQPYHEDKSQAFANVEYSSRTKDVSVTSISSVIERTCFLTVELSPFVIESAPLMTWLDFGPISSNELN
jgi:hypothetical protein